MSLTSTEIRVLLDDLLGVNRIPNRSSVEHPSDGQDGDGGDLRAADGNGRVALILVAVVDVGLDVVVGRVVVGLLHAALGVAALQDVADLALDVLDHFAAVGILAFVTRDQGELRSVIAIHISFGQALEAFESRDGRDGEHAKQGQSHQELRRARHDEGLLLFFFSLLEER